MTAPAIPAPATASFAARLPSGSPPAPAPGPHTVGEIAEDLGRSTGAVGNALTTLADRGEASRITGAAALRVQLGDRRSRRHHPQGPLSAQGRPCRSAATSQAVARAVAVSPRTA
jgi:hypothetical protein